MRIITNNVPRETLSGFELTDAERADFDYLDWEAIKEGSDSATFFRYKGNVYDLGEFMGTGNLPRFSPLAKWHGYHNDSYFSGIVIKIIDDTGDVIVGTFIA